MSSYDKSRNGTLLDVFNSGILDNADIRQLENIIEMKKDELLLRTHEYKIWQGKDENWYTYLPDPKGRKLKVKKNKTDLERDIIAFYKSLLNQEETEKTFKDCFDMWVERKKNLGINNSTLYKYGTDYRRFLTSWNNIDIAKITSKTVDDLLIKALTLEIRWQALKQLFYLIKDVFALAYRERLIRENPCDFVDLMAYKRRCVSTDFTPEKRIFSLEELAKLHKVLLQDLKEKPWYIPMYALPVALCTGMRAGEISYLKWENIKYDEGYILICGSEKFDRLTREYYDSTTKTGKERRIPLTDEMINLFDLIKKTKEEYGYYSPFVFSNENGRIHTNALENAAIRRCKKAGCSNKGLQTARRTVNSYLKSIGISSSIASSVLGHTEDVNERFYTYDTSNMDYKKEAMEKVNQMLNPNHT